jgi:hypothetical protein
VVTAPTEFRDKFTALEGLMIDAGGGRQTVQVSLYWNSSNSLAYVIGVRAEGDQEAWEVARSLFIAADSAQAKGGFVGGGDFAIGYNARTQRAVLYFKPGHEDRSKWAQVAIPAQVVREFVNQTFNVADVNAEHDVIGRQIDRAIERCLSAGE